MIEKLIYRKQWCKIIEDKLLNLRSYRVWLIESLLKRWKVIKCKWVFKIKYDEKEWVVKFKARLVTQNFLQIYKLIIMKYLLLWFVKSCWQYF